MSYNLTNVTDSANTFYEILFELNNVTQGYLAGLILALTFFIIFIMFSHHDTKVVFLYDSFVVTILAIFFWILNLVPFYIIFFPLILLVVSILIKVFTKDN